MTHHYKSVEKSEFPFREIELDRNERRNRDDQWNAVLDAEEMKVRDLEREVVVIDQYAADWKRLDLMEKS